MQISSLVTIRLTEIDRQHPRQFRSNGLSRATFMTFFCTYREPDNRTHHISSLCTWSVFKLLKFRSFPFQSNAFALIKFNLSVDNVRPNARTISLAQWKKTSIAEILAASWPALESYDFRIYVVQKAPFFFFRAETSQRKKVVGDSTKLIYSRNTYPSMPPKYKSVMFFCIFAIYYSIWRCCFVRLLSGCWRIAGCRLHTRSYTKVCWYYGDITYFMSVCGVVWVENTVLHHCVVLTD